MDRSLRAREKIPVLGLDGRTFLGYCEVWKFSRAAGNPIKEIRVTDFADLPVAQIFVYRRHSRVQCGSLEANVAPIDSRQVVEVARAAMEALSREPETVLSAIAARVEELILEGGVEFDSD